MDLSVAHHIKGLRPALGVMKDLGFSESECLKDTGISTELLEHPEKGISLQQELAFYRRLLLLSGDPLIGLSLGKAYRIESYGVLGYAILSSQNLGDALALVSEFGSLSFTHFSIGFTVKDTLASIYMQGLKPLDPSLLALFSDRDFAAVIFGTEAALNQSFPIQKVTLMHDGQAYLGQYESFFKCPVSFNENRMEMFFDAAFLSSPMPLRDSETLEYCRQQCERLLKKFTQKNSIADQVRHLLLARTNSFPNIKETSSILNIPERSLRRRLHEEGCRYQTLLNEVRYQLACEYLNSDESLDSIAKRLAYTETANFSHAFKRWSGISPNKYRKTRSVT